MDNNTPHLKSPKNQKKEEPHWNGQQLNYWGGGVLQLVCGRPTLAFSSALVPETLNCLVCVEDS